MSDYLSCKQAAQTLGVSGSTIKRMCDDGVVPSMRTPGGHRRIPRTAIDSWLISNDLPRIDPPPRRDVPQSCDAAALVTMLRQGHIESISDRLCDALHQSDEFATTLDTVVAPAMWEIGERWSTGEFEVYEEHLCTANLRTSLLQASSHLTKLRSADVLESRPRAIGCSVDGESHDLVSLMIELVMRSSGVDAKSLGGSVPVESLIAAILAEHADLVWTSYTRIEDPEEMLRQHHVLVNALPDHCRLLIGGQALTASLRRQMTFDFHGDSLLHLQRYVSSVMQRAFATTAG
ncbi:MAG: excisionase family DNA-binding protein [Planctomycetota bacterium]